MSESMTTQEITRELAMVAGTRPTAPHNQMGKATLNSLHAYLTGGFYIRPGDLYAEGGPDKHEVKRMVFRFVGVEDPPEGYVRRGDVSRLLTAVTHLEDQRTWID